MAGNEKRMRQREGRQARLAAAAAAQRRAARRRMAVWVGVGTLMLLGVIWLVSSGGDDDTEEATGSSTTLDASTQSTLAAAGSVGGKPCVAVSDPLPAGAPAVPVKEGPPPSQLIKEDLKVGSGAEVTPGATVRVNYIGAACTTGKIFDSSYSRNEPVSFPLGQVIKGWQDGIPGMKVGGQRLLGIPASQAYGAAGRPPSIAPDEPLWFVVEVLETRAA